MRYRVLVVFWIVLSVGLPIRAEILPTQHVVIAEADSAVHWWAVLSPARAVELLCTGFTGPVAGLTSVPYAAEVADAARANPLSAVQTLQSKHMRLQV